MTFYSSISGDRKRKTIAALCSGDVDSLKTVDVSEIDDDKRFRAIFKGFKHVHFVEYMLEHQWKDIIENCDFWAMHAVKQHPLHIIEQLCQYSTAPLNEALVAAARSTRADVVAVVGVLLPHCDPTAHNSKALQYASVNGNLELVDLLYPVSNPADALNALKKLSSDCKDWMMIEQRIEAERIKGVLETYIEIESQGQKRERKM